MRALEMAEQLSKELGIYLGLSRLAKYEERGIIPLPKDTGNCKEYSTQDVDRIKKVVVLSEIGVPLGAVRKYLLNKDKSEIEQSIKKRIEELSKLLEIAKGIWSNGATNG